MSKAVIQVDHISKKYKIGQGKNSSLYHTLGNLFNNKKQTEEEFWALKDVSFEIAQGEIVGIIGKNGAGKSTLLKILSRITEPTSGRIQIDGRVASLLEVGTGFHPELTGRENIFLNGSILGMKRQEIKKKFDEIIDFSGISKFIDTPVKHYSSGMYVRLAFSVAAHLEPEILIVDEVLSVGDAEFQKKCLGKMSYVSQSGRTVIIVSHNMGAIRNLSSKCLLFSSGCLVDQSLNVNQVILNYLEAHKPITNSSAFSNLNREGNGKIRFTSVNLSNRENNVILSGEDLKLEFRYVKSISHDMNDVKIKFHLYSEEGDLLFICNSSHTNSNYSIKNEFGTIKCTIKKLPLNVGRYYISVFAKQRQEIIDCVEYAFELDVENGDFYRSGKLPLGEAKFLLNSDWS